MHWVINKFAKLILAGQVERIQPKDENKVSNSKLFNSQNCNYEELQRKRK